MASGTANIERYFETGQKDLATAAKVYEVLQIYGGDAVVVKAKVGNAGLVHIGQAKVSATTGFELAPGEAVRIRYSGVRLVITPLGKDAEMPIEIKSLDDKQREESIRLYAVAVTAGDDVCYIRVP